MDDHSDDICAGWDRKYPTPAGLCEEGLRATIISVETPCSTACFLTARSAPAKVASSRPNLPIADVGSRGRVTPNARAKAGSKSWTPRCGSAGRFDSHRPRRIHKPPPPDHESPGNRESLRPRRQTAVQAQYLCIFHHRLRALNGGFLNLAASPLLLTCQPSIEP